MMAIRVGATASLCAFAHAPRQSPHTFLRLRDKARAAERKRYFVGLSSYRTSASLPFKDARQRAYVPTDLSYICLRGAFDE